MSRIDKERLLRELAQLEELEPWDELASAAEGAEEPPADEVFEAYREGRLPQPQARRLEALLGRSDTARARLIQLAGLEPPAAIRDQRRPGFTAVRAEAATVQRQRSRRIEIWRWATAAAALIMVVAGIQLLRPVPGPAPVPLPRLQASIQGLAAVRSGDAAKATRAAATPRTAVEITAALDPPRAGLEVALYVAARDGRKLARLPLAPSWEGRSIATFRAPAAELVGSEVGEHPLFVVVGQKGRLPARAVVRSEDRAAEELAVEAGARVQALILEIVHDAPFETGDPERPREEASYP